MFFWAAIVAAKLLQRGSFLKRTDDGRWMFILSVGEAVASVRSQDRAGPNRRDHDQPRFAGECAGDSFRQ
jgi:hypothetical protein